MPDLAPQCLVCTQEPNGLSVERNTEIWLLNGTADAVCAKHIDLLLFERAGWTEEIEARGNRRELLERGVNPDA